MGKWINNFFSFHNSTNTVASSRSGHSLLILFFPRELEKKLWKKSKGKKNILQFTWGVNLLSYFVWFFDLELILGKTYPEIVLHLPKGLENLRN